MVNGAAESHGVPEAPGSLLLGSAGSFRRDQLGTYEQAMHRCGDMARFQIGPPRLGWLFDATFHPQGAREVLAHRDVVERHPSSPSCAA